MAAKDDKGLSAVVAGHDAVRLPFVRDASQSSADDGRMPRAVNDDWPVAGLTWSLGEIGNDPFVRVAMIAYDDEYSLKFMGRKLASVTIGSMVRLPTPSMLML